jgi:uncharacterized membrane protein YbhN (UPF0104 family)
MESEEDRLPRGMTWRGRLLRSAGALLAVVCLGYVAWRAVAAADSLGRDFLTPSFIAAIAAAGFVYALLGLLIGLAWYCLLAATGQAHLPLLQALTIFGRAQLLKYLPSNLLHYVGRHAAAHRLGAPHGALVWSSIAEAVLVTATAAVVTGLFAQPLVTRALGELHSPIWLRVLLPTLAIAALVAATAYLLASGSKAKAKNLTSLAKGSAIACGLYALFFFANGAILAGLVAALPGNVFVPPLMLAGVASLAWFVGFIVPGAPAGIGIRDFVLTIGLEEAGLGSAALSIALAYRIVTLLGDLLLALASFAVAMYWQTRPS